MTSTERQMLAKLEEVTRERDVACARLREVEASLERERDAHQNTKDQLRLEQADGMVVHDTLEKCNELCVAMASEIETEERYHRGSSVAAQWRWELWLDCLADAPDRVELVCQANVGAGMAAGMAEAKLDHLQSAVNLAFEGLMYALPEHTCPNGAGRKLPGPWVSNRACPVCRALGVLQGIVPRPPPATDMVEVVLELNP